MTTEVPNDVQRARAGDRAAWRRLYDAHADAVLGLCIAFARDRAIGMDLAQDAFTAAFAALGTLREPDRFSGWLMSITRRTCLQWAARRRREEGALVRFGREPKTPVPPRSEAATGVVAEVVAACPDPALRAVAERFYLEPARTVPEIAEELGITPSNVTTRLHRFRAWAKVRMLHRLAAALEDG